MSTPKLTLIFATLAFALALAVTASAASAAQTPTDLAWGGGQARSQGPHDYGFNC